MCIRDRSLYLDVFGNELDILGVPAMTCLHKCSCACQAGTVRSSTTTHPNIESENPSLWKVGSPNLSSSLVYFLLLIPPLPRDTWLAVCLLLMNIWLVPESWGPTSQYGWSQGHHSNGGMRSRKNGEKCAFCIDFSLEMIWAAADPWLHDHEWEWIPTLATIIQLRWFHLQS